MNITSLHFLYFVIIVLIIYHAIPQRLRKYFLLAVSYVFYATWSWQFCLVLLGLTIFNYFIALRLQNITQKQIKWLWVGIVFNIGTLLFFRTANFFLPEFIHFLSILGIQLIEISSLQILLPIGMAYYSLQNISYLVDVHHRQTDAAANFIDFALYLAYFPKLLSGPIERERTLMPKLVQPRRVNNEVLARSFTLIIIGLIRKLFIAGLLSSIIFWDAFETPSKYTGPELISWIVLYGFFLYNDFAGYTSIARGVSGFFGIELSKNFNQPYFAHNMTEFWNSWHISLSHWLRDYIYFPISRTILKGRTAQRRVMNMLFPPMVTMLVSGLWHGLSWHMLLWGGLHGLYQVAERIASLRKTVLSPQQQPIWRRGFSISIVFVLVSLAWVPFVMDLPIALDYWRGMFDWTYPIIRYRRILLAIPLFIVVLLFDLLQRRYQDDEFILRWPRLVQASLLAGCIFILLILLQGEQSEPFVYQGF
jgi:D-alanyl-lipoteichoic acid acyltransferase DltB (MBOAT superfamily)